ncbi:hypothetical protein [Streptomyces sp. NPDC096153]|uniref:hypothetical protein n=1 Tax=Streptomyces sp. NPDC096153 TaxID=3155548 RepID=UPI00331D13F6
MATSDRPARMAAHAAVDTRQKYHEEPMVTPDNTTVMTCMNAWSTRKLPLLNRSIINGTLRPQAMVEELSALLRDVPSPDLFSLRETKQALVHLSLAAASVVRHYQECDLATDGELDLPLRLITVGADRTPFREYFNRLADRSGTGHPHRDSYAALARWNVPTVEVIWRGEIVCRIPGAFEDGSIRTYTGDPGEVGFFSVLKRAEAVELAVNQILTEVINHLSDLSFRDAIHRLNTASALLATVHRLNLDFASTPPDEALRPDHFLDVFRQFATHWDPGDIPPSGAQDVEFLKRDFLLGINFPGYFQHVRRIFPSFLDDERASLTRMASEPSLPSRLVSQSKIPGLQEAPADLLRSAVRDDPRLAACYFLLQTNSRVASSHLMLTKKYLFKPHRDRERAGVPDGKLVSHRAGTTGMVEKLLERLMQARKDHELTFLDRTDRKFLMEAAGVEGEARISSKEAAEIVRFR